MWLFYDWTPWFFSSMLHLTLMQKLRYTLMKKIIYQRYVLQVRIWMHTAQLRCYMFMMGVKGPVAVQTGFIFHCMNSSSRKTSIYFFEAKHKFLFYGHKWKVRYQHKISAAPLNIGVLRVDYKDTVCPSRTRRMSQPRWEWRRTG